MDSSFILSSMEEDFFKKIAKDLKYALKDLTAEELWEIFKQSSLESARTTYNTKKQSLNQTGKVLKILYNRYKQNGILESAKFDTIKLKDFTIALPEKVQIVYSNFLKLKREEQIEIVIVTILTLAIFFASAGGSDLEGGIPDIDLAIGGVAHHRSFITHSILIGLGIEFTGRFSILTLEKIKDRMPRDRHSIWDNIFYYINKHKGKAISAMWLGIGAHLIKDSGIFGGGVTSYKDLPFSMPLTAHESLFAANSIMSGVFTNS